MRMMSHSKLLAKQFYVQFLRSSVMMDGVPSKVNVLLQVVSYPGLVFFLRKMSNPRLVFFSRESVQS